MKRTILFLALILLAFPLWSFGQLFRITVTPSEPFGTVYWGDAYAIKVDGLANTYIDVRIVDPQGATVDVPSLWNLNSYGFAVQPVDSGTTPGTYTITHIKQSGTQTWHSVPNVRITIVGQSLPQDEREMHAQSRLVPIGSGYSLHFPNMSSKAVDVQVEFNGGSAQTLYNVWQLDSRGIAYQPVSSGTSLGTYNFVRYKAHDEGQNQWRNTGDLRVYVTAADATLQNDNLLLAFDKTAGGVLFWASQRKHADVNLVNENLDRGREIQADLIDGYVGVVPNTSFRYDTTNPTHAAGSGGQYYVPLLPNTWSRGSNYVTASVIPYDYSANISLYDGAYRHSMIDGRYPQTGWEMSFTYTLSGNQILYETTWSHNDNNDPYPANHRVYQFRVFSFFDSTYFQRPLVNEDKRDWDSWCDDLINDTEIVSDAPDLGLRVTISGSIDNHPYTLHSKAGYEPNQVRPLHKRMFYISVGIVVSGVAIRSKLLIFSGVIINISAFVGLNLAWMYHSLLAGIVAVVAVLIPGIVLMVQYRKRKHV